jgi:hypothetical protein
MSPLKYGLVFCLFFSNFCLDIKAQSPTAFVGKTKEKINLDGFLEETAWQKALPISNFIQNFPIDTLPAQSQTEVRLLFDENFLYIAAICKGNATSDFVVTSLRRDFDWELNDNFSVYLNPSQDQLNGFAFAVSPYNVQLEGLIFEGDNISTSWDNKWYSAAQIQEGFWTVEMAIPFKTLRFSPDKNTWKVNFARNDVRRNEISAWVRVPINFRVAALAFTADLVFDEKIEKKGANISLIPYLTGSTSDSKLDQEKPAHQANAGFDAKIAVTPSLNLDLTVNPDFSQVEVDRQVTNLDRFEIFFPERRQFFLENSDLFERFGFSRIRPFFSRRIGIGRDTTTGLIVQNPIYYGARLSGKLDKNWRVGLLNMQTAKDPSAGINSQNYTVAAFQRQLFSRSNLAGIFINRQTFGDLQQEQSRFTRIAGLDYNVQSADNKWRGKIFYHQAFLPEPNSSKNQFLKETYAHAAYLAYNSRRFYAAWNHELVGKNYNINDIGFVLRNSHWRFEYWAGYNFYPKSKTINRHGIYAYLNFYTDLDFSLKDRNVSLRYNFLFLNQSYVEAGYYRDFLRLFFPFDPTNTGGKVFEVGSQIQNSGFWIYYYSDRRKRFNFEASLDRSAYYTGSRTNAGATLNYRFQPYGAVALTLTHNDIQLPAPYNSAQLWIISPRVDVSFTDKLFLTTFLQYNSQIENINLNARLQWRFKPVSDLFLVYSENYFPESFQTKNRALVLKLSYWLNL